MGGSSQRRGLQSPLIPIRESTTASPLPTGGVREQADVTVPAPGEQKGRSRLLTIYRGQLIFKGGGLDSPASVGLWSRAQDPRWPFIVAPSCHPTALPYYILSRSSGPGCGRSETAGWRSGGPSRQPRLPACSGS